MHGDAASQGIKWTRTKINNLQEYLSINILYLLFESHFLKLTLVCLLFTPYLRLYRYRYLLSVYWVSQKNGKNAHFDMRSVCMRRKKYASLVKNKILLDYSFFITLSRFPLYSCRTDLKQYHSKYLTFVIRPFSDTWNSFFSNLINKTNILDHFYVNSTTSNHICWINRLPIRSLMKTIQTSTIFLLCSKLGITS